MAPVPSSPLYFIAQLVILLYHQTYSLVMAFLTGEDFFISIHILGLCWALCSPSLNLLIMTQPGFTGAVYVFHMVFSLTELGELLCVFPIGFLGFLLCWGKSLYLGLLKDAEGLGWSLLSVFSAHPHGITGSITEQHITCWVDFAAFHSLIGLVVPAGGKSHQAQ